MKEKTIVWSAIVALFFSQPSWASNTSSVCNGCTLAKLHQEALDLGDGDHYFFDFYGQRMTHYRVAGEAPRVSTFHSAALGYSAQIVPLVSGESKLFAATLDLYWINNSSVYVSAHASADIDLRETAAYFSLAYRSESTAGKMNAFDMVETPVYRKMAIDQQTSFSKKPFLAFTNAIRAAAGTVVFALNAVPFVKVPIVMKNRLHFPDGSTCIIQYDFSSQQFVYVPGSARDAVGNPIPETPLEVSGGGTMNYVFPGTPAGQMAGLDQVAHLQRMNILVKVPSTRGSGWVMACSNINDELPKCVAWPR
ncbi:MAG TPA: hypothetical protein VFH59_16905 [Frateuria sp.]|uniref:hypothetical protein n=1 Tax=Frateuria sp. TaxID=2211372 RepID=UPI002D7F069D|nr:hypothetical protein [Frateuria sp.]HET6807116.1 hypothetical protein [Frateuria sp.]